MIKNTDADEYPFCNQMWRGASQENYVTVTRERPG